MKRSSLWLWVVAFSLAVLLGASGGCVVAQDNGGPVLVQAKITSSSQFITIYNNGSSATTSSYQLIYYNNYDRSKATSSKVYALSGVLEAKSYYIFNDGQIDLCQKSKVDSVSLGLSTTSGSLELVKLESGNSTTVSTFKWVSKSAPEGVQLLPASVSGYDTFLQYDLSSNSWGQVQAPTSSPCNVQKVLISTNQSPTLPSGQAPAVSVQSVAAASIGRNSGLKSPVLNELLPNPKTPQTDSDDEFIELYNPNDRDFYLQDYWLEVGTTTVRRYTFSEDDILPARSYVAFMSSQTGLSLSNTGSQARLVDPSSAVISKSALYSTAEEGQAWSLVNGEWKWLMSSSPNKANDGVLVGPEETTTKLAESTSSSTNTSSGSSSSAKGADNSVASEQDDTLPLHPAVLAVIGVSAVGYGVYEYRRDIANRIFQFKRYLRLRREARAELQRQ